MDFFKCCTSSSVLKAVQAVDQIVDLSGSVVIDMSGNIDVSTIKVSIDAEKVVETVVGEVVETVAPEVAEPKTEEEAKANSTE